MANVNKPAYRVPSMEEIEGIPWNGYNVVSTFSGAGGSCLGYRMAGFNVLWASEFVPAAAEVYRLNHPNTHLDTRDIREVQPADILRRLNMDVGEIDLLDGSPPCASFSTAGKREEGWGKVKQYSDTRQRVDDLFFEYARILEGLQPRTFIAENVSGLVRGKAKGYFKMILGALREAGYRVRARVLDAQWLGVPQRRQRLIFMGVREDLGASPVYPSPLDYRYTLQEAIPWILSAEAQPHGPNSIDMTSLAADRPAPTLPQSRDGAGYYRHEIVVEPESCIDGYAIADEWDKMDVGEQSEKYFNLVKPKLDAPCPTVTQTGGITGAASVAHPTERRKFSISELKRICAFPDDFELTGSYSKRWERLGRAVPPVMMYWIARSVRTLLEGADGREPFQGDLPQYRGS